MIKLLSPTKEICIEKIKIGNNNPIALIGGPCVIESEESCLDLAREIKEISQKLDIPFIFKASYDKGNRSSIRSFRGPGIEEGLRILKNIKETLSVLILTDVHCTAQVKKVAEVVDVMQIPAFLSRQTDLILEAARTGKVINVKKGQFLAPWEMQNVIEKIESVGNDKIVLTERGTCFGYNNLVVDFRSLAIMRQLGYPVCFDVTHSVQLPGGAGTASGGQREFVPFLARAAAATGIDALFIEVHQEPEKALSDGPNMVRLSDLEGILQAVKEIDRFIKVENSQRL